MSADTHDIVKGLSGSFCYLKDLMYVTGEPFRGTTICLPGVLSRGYEKFKPLERHLRRMGDVVTVCYDGAGVGVAEEVAVLVMALRASGPVRLLGVSYGGWLIPDVVGYVDSLRSIMSKSLVDMAFVVDAPYGVEKLKEIQPPLRGLAASRIGVPLFKTVGFAVSHLGRGKPPRLENIEVPVSLNPQEARGYRDMVIRLSKDGLRGHNTGVYAGQIREMASRLPDVSRLEEAGVPTVYFSCNSPKNETVVQPLAQEGWLSGSSTVEVVEVNSAHAGFLEASATWDLAFGPIVDRVVGNKF